MIPSEILEGLFDEKKFRILKLFYSNPSEQYYLRELSRACNVPPATALRIINGLLSLKLIKLQKIKKTKLYSLARNEYTQTLLPLFEEKSDPMKDFVSFASTMEGVQRIVQHGKTTDDKINVLVIGEGLNSGALNDKCSEIKAEHGVSLVLLTLMEVQFEQMSSMGLFPGQKKTLWEK